MLGYETGGDHYGGIRGIGAAGDGSNGDGTISHMCLATGYRHESISSMAVLFFRVATIANGAPAQLFILVFFLGNGIGVGFTALGSKANEGILGHSVLLLRIKTVGKGSTECLPEVTHGDTILWAARTSQTRFDSAEIEFEQVIELWLRRVVCAEYPLRPGIV